MPNYWTRKTVTILECELCGSYEDDESAMSVHLQEVHKVRRACFQDYLGKS